MHGYLAAEGRVRPALFWFAGPDSKRENTSRAHYDVALALKH